MNTTILIVDDERSIRESLSKVLQRENYEILSAECGLEAIEKLRNTKVDLLLLDLGLPVKDGWGTLQLLAGANPFLPVIVITGRCHQREAAEKAGVDALMEKPLDVPCLLQTIRELIMEPMESRAQRASTRATSFRYMTCDHELFREMLIERLTTPFTSPKWKEAGANSGYPTPEYNSKAWRN